MHWSNAKFGPSQVIGTRRDRRRRLRQSSGYSPNRRQVLAQYLLTCRCCCDWRTQGSKTVCRIVVRLATQLSGEANKVFDRALAQAELVSDNIKHLLESEVLETYKFEDAPAIHLTLGIVSAHENDFGESLS